MANITIKLQMEDYPSQRDMVQTFPLDIPDQLVQPVDKPSINADPFAVAFLCTRPDTLGYIKENRKRFIQNMSINLAMIFTRSIEQHDTTMGYPDNACNNRKY